MRPLTEQELLAEQIIDLCRLYASGEMPNGDMQGRAEAIASNYTLLEEE